MKSRSCYINDKDKNKSSNIEKRKVLRRTIEGAGEHRRDTGRQAADHELYD